MLSAVLQIFKLHIQDRILLPILVIEVPPLGGIDLESLFLHRLAQQSAAGSLVGGAAGVVGVGAAGHLVVSAGHLHLFAGLEVVEAEINGASAIVLGALGGIGDEYLFVVGGCFPENFRDIPRTVAVVDDQAVSVGLEGAMGAKQRLRRRLLQKRPRFGIHRRAQKV